MKPPGAWRSCDISSIACMMSFMNQEVTYDEKPKTLIRRLLESELEVLL
ncbi:MAG: hypothetical protein HXS52_01545 [Theionarchaea archaeon]|nr:hypothetical protein [Theionarchaea archaeon]MBU7036587.1 hypothetical protein [Theionarchaea archaeon]